MSQGRGEEFRTYVFSRCRRLNKSHPSHNVSCGTSDTWGQGANDDFTRMAKKVVVIE